MNKLRSSSIVRPNAREDGTSNVTKFLAACASYGLPPEDLFSNDDFAVSSAESLARVAKTIIALFQLVETPFLHRSKVLVGQSGGHTDNSPNSPYSPGTFSRAAAASSPNLSSERLQRSVSPAGPPSPVRQRRFSPPGLPPVRSSSPEEPPPRQNNPSKPVKRDGVVATALVVDVDNDRITANPIIPALPPRSPRRPQPPLRQFDNDVDDPFTRAVESAAGGLPERASVADSTRVLAPGSARASLADSSLPMPIPIVQRHSTSSSMTETTTITSLLDFRQQNNSGTSSNTNNFGTVRTITTEATSAFSFCQAEDSPVSPSFFDEMVKKRRFSRERKMSGTGNADLVRVPEEVEEGSTYKAGGGLMAKGKAKAQDHEREKVERTHTHLGKGKRPDDFFTPQIQNHSPTMSRPPDQEDSPSRISNPLSSSPTRKLAIPGANRRSESLEVLPEFPRPSLHRPSHSIDIPGLLPKAYARDASPDGLAAASGRVMPRRQSTKPNVQRNGICIPRLNIDNPRNSCGSGDSLVPFPRAVSGDHPSPSPSPSFDTRAGGESSGIHDNPRPVRGRFQSDVEGSSTRRPRPSSYDELGARPARTRFESMVNLGVVTGNASASDLITRDSMDGSAVRKTLIVKEQGKPPTHFVSLLIL